MFKNQSVTRKLLLMVSIPIAGMLLFGGELVSSSFQAYQESRRVNDLAKITLALTNFVHENQKERGLTAGFAASGGTKFATELPAQQATTDSRAAELQKEIAKYANGLGAGFDEVAESIEEQLRELKGLRDQIRAQALKPSEAINRYTAMNAKLLGNIVLMAKMSGVAASAAKFYTFSNFQGAKEYAGIERASGNLAVSTDAFPPGVYEAFLGSIARQKVYEQVALGTATADERQAYKSKVVGEAVSEVDRMERLLLENADKGKFGIDPTYWFKMNTAKIDLMKEAQELMIKNMLDFLEQRSGEAVRALWFSIFLAIAIVALALVAAMLGARSISKPLAEAGRTALDVANQVMAAVQQQSATTNETASSVSETTTTIEEIRQTSQMATQKAKAVVEIAEKSSAASEGAIQAVEQGLEAMNRIRAEVESIARNILELSEKNMQIGEIVQSVNAIAEQSNLLAVNASIEAAKAGEQGKGFAVVAGEVKALATQSKEATDQIRGILGQIQKSSNAAVMVTEQGTKRVEEGIRIVEQLGRSIRDLTKVIERSSDAANQISVAAGQQLAGIDQITGAMRSIEQAARENATGARELEKVTEQIRNVVTELDRVNMGAKAGT